MIDDALLNILGITRRPDETAEDVRRRAENVIRARPRGTVTDLAMAIVLACGSVQCVGHRQRTEEVPRTKWQRFLFGVVMWWQRHPVRRWVTLMHPLLKHGPVSYPVAEFAVMVKRGQEPDHAAITGAVEQVRPVGASVELHYYEVVA